MPGRVLMENAGRAVADEVAIAFRMRATSPCFAAPATMAAMVSSLPAISPNEAMRSGLASTATHRACRRMRQRWPSSGPAPSSLCIETCLLQARMSWSTPCSAQGWRVPSKAILPRLIEAVNASGLPVSPWTCRAASTAPPARCRGVAIEAAATVTFFRLKPGHLLLAGAELCGETRVADIGIPDSVLETIKPKTFANEPALWLAAVSLAAAARPQICARARRGRLGSRLLDRRGEARRHGRVARIGAGLVTVASPKRRAWRSTPRSSRRSWCARQTMRAASRPPRRRAQERRPDRPRRRRRRAHQGHGACGARARCRASCSTPTRSRPLPTIRRRCSHAIRARAAPVALTPHDGEFARLFGDIRGGAKARARARGSRPLRRDRAAEGRRHRRRRAGRQRVDQRHDRARGSPPRAPAMCLPASCLASWRKRMPAFEAASAAVWVHGRAAAAFGPGLIAEDLPEMLPAVLRGFGGNG